MEEFRTIDLFAGAGGITEGFRQAGAHCLFANDFNASAVETFRLHKEARSQAQINCGVVFKKSF